MARGSLTDVTAVLGKSEDGVSLWVRRRARRTEEDQRSEALAEELDTAFSQGGEVIHNTYGNRCLAPFFLSFLAPFHERDYTSDPGTTFDLR